MLQNPKNFKIQGILDFRFSDYRALKLEIWEYFRVSHFQVSNAQSVLHLRGTIPEHFFR